MSKSQTSFKNLAILFDELNDRQVVAGFYHFLGFLDTCGEITETSVYDGLEIAAKYANLQKR